MAYDKELKVKIKAYFETHMDAPKEVAKKFEVKERTMRHWIETEGWKMGLYITPLKLKKIKKQISAQQVSDTLKEVKSDLIEDIKKEMALDKSRGELDVMLDNSFIGEVSDSIIFQAMTEGFLNKELSTTMLIARNIFHHNVAINPYSHANMGLAKDYAGMVRDFKKSMYNNEPSNVINIHNVGTLKQDDLSNMSDDDLRRLIALENEIQE